jgi:hypothetical protein
MYQRALTALQQAKMELQRSTNDFDGHRDSAMEACDKAIVELQAVVKVAGPQQPMMPRPQPPIPTPLQSAPPPSPAPATPTPAPGQP